MNALKPLAAEMRAWLFDHALPLWATAGVNPDTGGFQDLLGLDGRPVPAVQRARVQARQVYVYATAGALGWDGPWRSVMERGLAYFVRHWRRPDGLFRTTVNANSSPADDSAWAYDQAFALFAMAAVATAVPERTDALGAEAAALLDAMQAKLALPAGGFREADPRRPYQSNPHMHLFEASLAWEAATGDVRWSQMADTIAALCRRHFLDPRTGALREFFDADWNPAAGADGRIVEPGHQLEWAWLLQRWSLSRGDAEGSAAAERLFTIGSVQGVDTARNVAFNILDDTLTPTDLSARLWPQTERIKAALIMARTASTPWARSQAARQAEDGVRGLQAYLQVQTPGLWRDKMKTDGTFVDEPAPASSFYHIICACADLFAAVDA
jgi:mannose/cellobiose epimerase-like protein (N-acyl-D-glucosamine 2-epimerase family)